MFRCGCFSCRRSLDLASACCVLRSPGLCVCGGAFFFPFAEWMRKQFKVKVAFSKKIKKGYLVKRPKRPLIFWTKRLPKSLKVLYFFWVSTPSNPVRAPKRHPTTTAWRRWKVTDQPSARNRPFHDAGPEPRKKGSGFDWRCFTFTFWSSLHDFFREFFFSGQWWVLNLSGSTYFVKETWHLGGIYMRVVSPNPPFIDWFFGQKTHQNRAGHLWWQITVRWRQPLQVS